MENYLENQRNCHENREILMKLMSDNILPDKSLNDKQKLTGKLKVKFFLQKFQDFTKQLISGYSEEYDGLRKEEIFRLTDMSNFYRELKLIYKKNEVIAGSPWVTMMELDQEAEEFAEKKLQKFTDEENFGSFLDLHKPYQFYLNLKLDHHQDYIGYLRSLKQLTEISELNKDSRYLLHLRETLNYLEDFKERTHPLEEAKLEVYKKKIDEEIFKETWKRLKKMEDQMVDLSFFSSCDEIQALGMEGLKNHLNARGMKTGGTLEERAIRLFAARDVKTVKSLNPRTEKNLRLEQAFLFYVDLLSDKICKTIDNVQRKQGRADNSDENESDLDESEEEDDDFQKIPYNPKNLPLQHDGTPIPYWLYKLQSLNKTFECEICGNVVYRGPKAFHNHFSESRHAHGMKCLGIPNTSHFYYISKIEEVLNLYEKIKEDRKMFQWNRDQEEMEDSFGNVMKRKTWLDLERQGCI